MTPPESQHIHNLICHALRHRWVPFAGNAGRNVDGARVLEWQLICEKGCGSEAFEWRDLYGNRLPGTQRRYELTESYKKGGGYTQGEYMSALLKRKDERSDI